MFFYQYRLFIPRNCVTVCQYSMSRVYLLHDNQFRYVLYCEKKSNVFCTIMSAVLLNAVLMKIAMLVNLESLAQNSYLILYLFALYFGDN